jgi:hypothetical protein
LPLRRLCETVRVKARMHKGLNGGASLFLV